MTREREKSETTSFFVTTPPGPGDSQILVGKRAGGYRMDQVMGEGPRTYVYKGLQCNLNRTVALKILKRDYVADVERIEDYLEAARSASSLIHPNIVKIYDVVSMGDLHFVASELIEATTLDAWLDEGRSLEAGAVQHIARECIEALLYAHGAGRPHGNLYPSNVFMGPGERVRISDFGFHSILPRRRPETESEIWRAGYLAPEQLHGGEPDALTDLFSLGCILYHALVGCPPYAMETVREALRGGEYEAPVPAREANPAVPTALSNFVAGLTAPDRALRPRSAEEAVIRLQDVADKPAARIGPDLMRRLLERGNGLPPPSRRSYKRMREEIDVNVIPRKTSQDSALMLLTKIRNLSENGAFVVCDEPLPVGEFVTLDFNLASRKAQVHVLGVVRWVETGPRRQGMGVQFLEVSTTDRKNLRDYVDSRIVREMVQALTRTQIHKAVLRIVLCSWGQDLSFERLVRVTGASRVLLQRTLADFEKYNLARMKGQTVQCIRPATPTLVTALAEALRS